MSTKEAKKEALRLRGEVVKAGLWPCCLNCDHWKTLRDDTPAGSDLTFGDRYCSKYTITPPPETIVVGCIQHIPYIPF